MSSDGTIIPVSGPRIERFQDRVALVTGGGSGIGLGIARALSRAGATVVVADRDEPAAKEAAAEIAGHAYVIDVTDVAAVEEMAGWVRSTFGRLDVLVNNAGVGPQDYFNSFSLADLKWVHDINYWGVVYGIKAFLPLLEENAAGAAIVNTASMASVLVGPGGTAYAPTKAAILSLSDSLRAELAPAGRVGVTVLIPAIVETNILANAAQRPGQAGRTSDTSDFVPPLRTISADRVGDMVLDALRRGTAHLFTHNETVPMLAARFDELLTANKEAPGE